jgi:hypothetical protein
MLPLSPRQSPSQGCPRKGQASSRVTPWIGPRHSPHAQVSLLDDLSQTALSSSSLSKASNRNATGLIPSCTPVPATPQTQLVCVTTSPSEWSEVYKPQLTIGLNLEQAL